MTTVSQQGAGANRPVSTLSGSAAHQSHLTGQAGTDRGLRPPDSPVRLARMAGALYLVMAVFGGFAQAVRVSVYKPDDADATTANLLAHATLVRVSFVADVVQALVWLVMAAVLQRLFEHAGRGLARTLVVFVAFSAAIASVNMINQIGALNVATHDTYATAFGPDGSHALVLLLMDLQHYGYLIAQLGWLWLFVLGVLGNRSGMFPRWLSYLLMLGTVSYVADALTRFLAPSFADTSATIWVGPEIVCEVALLGYLLIKGVRTTGSSTASATGLGPSA